MIILLMVIVTMVIIFLVPWRKVYCIGCHKFTWQRPTGYGTGIGSPTNIHATNEYRCACGTLNEEYTPEYIGYLNNQITTSRYYHNHRPKKDHLLHREKEDEDRKILYPAVLDKQRAAIKLYAAWLAEFLKGGGVPRYSRDYNTSLGDFELIEKIKLPLPVRHGSMSRKVIVLYGPVVPLGDVGHDNYFFMEDPKKHMRKNVATYTNMPPTRYPKA